MQCANCQQDSPSQARFCMTCGAGLMRPCVRCATELPVTASFCFMCGLPVPGAEPIPGPRGSTPKHLAEKILTLRNALAGERKQVTVLFADVKGSMELLLDRDPEEAGRILEPVVQLMIEVVHRYEGTVNHVMGDGIMAIFGAPLALEEHAVRACYAALEMQRAVKRHAEEAFRSQGVLIQIRVGLNSGEVVMRTIGSDLHMDYTAIGQTTHLAARMEQLAAPGTIRLTPETLRMAEGFVHATSLGRVPVKGLAESVEIFELASAAAITTRWQATAARGLTRFVGRQAELAVLRQVIHRVTEGHGQVVAIVGGPGVGKSRLVWEFIHPMRVGNWLVLEIGSAPYGRDAAYSPLRDLLIAYFEVEQDDDEGTRREKVVRRISALDPHFESDLPALLGLLGLPVEDRRWAALDASQRRRRALECLTRLVLRESAARPVLVVAEDLHWAGPETREVLDSLVQSLRSARFFLLVDYRPEYSHGWRGGPAYTQVDLDPLPRESAAELLRVLLGEDPSLAPIARLLVERSEGNPFFLEESVRALVETEVLVGEPGAYRSARTPPRSHVPATVQAVLAARIDRLPATEKSLLQTASVIGREVPHRLLSAIADLPEDELRQELRHLQVAGFLYEMRPFPDLEYRFQHALTHDVAYGSLLKERRRALHARIVAAIEDLGRERSAEDVDRLADHALRGEVWDRALVHTRHAGLKALSGLAFAAAVTRFEQALEALSHLAETREAREQAIDLRFDLRHAIFPLGQPERGLRYLREAEELARKLDDQRRIGWVSAYMCYYLLPTDIAEGLTLARAARAIAERFGDVTLHVAASYYVGLACCNAGAYREAVAAFQKAMALLEQVPSEERCGLIGVPNSVSRSWLAISLAYLGEFDEAMAHGEAGLRFAEAIDHPYSVIIACRNLAAIHALRGELGESIGLLERGLALARERQVEDLIPGVTARLGHALVLEGQQAEGLALLEEGVKLNESTGRRGSHSLLIAFHGEGCALAGRLDDALASATQALTHARGHGERGDEAYALHLHGAIAARVEPPDLATASARFRAALDLASELSMRPLQAHCHLGLGRLLRRIGRREESEEHLGAAQTLLQKMRMRVPGALGGSAGLQ